MTAFRADAIERLRALLADRTPVEVSDPLRRDAAVLVPLFVREDELWVALTKKTMHLRRHRGEVAFPGGGRDAADGSLLDTALREAHEEAGIRPSDVEVIGVLDDLPTATTGYLVRPFVGVIPHPYAFVADGFEVERVLTAPLRWFVDPSRMREEIWERGGTRFTMTFHDLDGDLVWGATARIMSVLIALLEGREPPPFPRILPQDDV